MPKIEKKEMDHWQSAGGWKSLEKTAADIVSATEASAGNVRMSPLLGGGTRLMLEMNQMMSPCGSIPLRTITVRHCRFFRDPIPPGYRRTLRFAFPKTSSGTCTGLPRSPSETCER